MKDNLLGLAHIGIFSPDRKASLEFYRDLLDFEVTYNVDVPEPHSVNITFLKKGNMTIELLVPHRDTEKITAGAMGTCNHLTILCKNIDEIMAALAKKGIAFETATPDFVPQFNNPPGDIKIAFCRGPAGERIEFYEELN
ncbi:MAG: VOC family protein [Syntrophobacterales bacterium]|nr:VOC family protein [Syntrophobacterales bacterium]